MTDTATPSPPAAGERYALNPMYLFRWEPTQDSHVLLYPEGIVKLNQTAGALGKLEGEGPGWSAYVPGLDRFLYRAPHAPQAGSERGRNPKTAQERQCSLLSKA